MLRTIYSGGLPENRETGFRTALLREPEGLSLDDVQVWPHPNESTLDLWQAVFTSDELDSDPVEKRIYARHFVAAAEVFLALAANPDWCARKAQVLLEWAQEHFREADALEAEGRE